MEGFFLTEALVFLIVFVVSSTFYFLFAGPAAVEEFSLLLIVLALLNAACVSSFPCFSAPNNEGKFKAVVNNEIQYYSSCKKENGYNVCETSSGREDIVDNFWKK